MTSAQSPFSARSVAQLACLIAMAVALPAVLCRLLDHPDNLAAGEGVVKEFNSASEMRMLQKINPDWVLIGNSMLNSRLENAPLAEISGLKVRKVSKGGSQSALWFLYLKNVVLASGAKPAVVTIFFRDTDLTWPDLRVKGVNEDQIIALKGYEQPEWRQVFKYDSEGGRNLPNMIANGLNELFPAADLRPVARRSVQERSFRLTRIGTKMNSSARRVELNLRFSLTHLRHDLGSDFASSSSQPAQGVGTSGEVIDPGFYEDGPKSFDPSPEVSFLPHLVKLAADNNIRLHFHRIKRRPASNHERPDDLAMQDYMKVLRQWLETNHCLFTDESKDSTLTLGMYADGDHISDDAAIQERYLKNYWARVGPVVKPVFATRPRQEVKP